MDYISTLNDLIREPKYVIIIHNNGKFMQEVGETAFKITKAKMS